MRACFGKVFQKFVAQIPKGPRCSNFVERSPGPPARATILSWPTKNILKLEGLKTDVKGALFSQSQRNICFVWNLWNSWISDQNLQNKVYFRFPITQMFEFWWALPSDIWRSLKETFILNSGFYDVVSYLEGPFLPALKGKWSSSMTEKSNSSRFVTKMRWDGWGREIVLRMLALRFVPHRFAVAEVNKQN